MTIDQEQLKNLIDSYIEPLNTKWKNSISDTIEISCHNCKDVKNLSISLSKQVFHCWNCHVSGNLYKLFKVRSSVEGFNLYKSKYANNYKDKSFESIFNKEIEYVKQDIEIPKEYVYVANAENKFIYNPFFNYLYDDRFLTREILYKYNTYFDLKNNRVCFISYDKLGNVNFILSRSIETKANYINTGDKKRIIFNEYLINFNMPVFLCEGFFDYVRLKNAGLLLGTDLTEDYLLFKMLLLHNTPIIVILDNEPSSDMKVERIAEEFLKYNSNHPIYIGKFNDYKDIGEMKDIDITNFNFYEYNFEYKLKNKLINI